MKQVYKRLWMYVLASLLFANTYGQEFSVTGTVKDSFTGDPLAGVNVVVKGTTNGTITGIDGNYRISISEGNSLIFSFIGYVTTEIPVSSSTSTLDISLEEDVTNLEEVIVTGLASGIKRSNLANAVTSIGSEELTGNTTQATLDNAMFGKITGVNMVSNGGAPGGGVNVQLRGISTLGAGSSQPLYIIDGVYVDNSVIRNGRTQVNGASGGQSNATQDDASNRIADINPDDIESVEVLKGPSAAAIYGTRANAGVIIITTKKGKAGRTVVSWREDIGFSKALNLQGFEGWDDAKIEAVDGTGATAVAEKADLAANGENDWEDVLYGETGLIANSQLSISGGTDRTKFYVSGGYQTEDGIIQNTGFDRYSIRANIEHKLSPKLEFSINTNYAKTQTQRGFTGNQNNTGGSLGYNIAYTRSYADLFPDVNGVYPDNPYFNDNPLAVRDLGQNEENVDRFIAAGGFGWNIFQSPASLVKFTLNGGVDFLSSRSFVYFPEILQHQKALANPGDVMHGKQENINTNAQAFLIWNVQKGAVNFNTQVGTTWLTQDRDLLLTRGRGLAAGQTNLAWAQVVSVQQDFEGHVIDQGIVAQEEINWDDKIISTLGVRFDRSTLNLNQTKFYAFPKFSLAANVANFDFWTSSTVNQLKVRVAYGETGGLAALGSTYESLTSQLIGGQLGAQVGNRAVDNNLNPETAAELELGLDMGFLDNKLGFELTWYNKTVNDLILDQQPVESSGIGAIATNAADLVNKGLEFALSWQVVRNTNIAWFTRAMYWTNDVEITRLDIPAYNTGGFGPSLGTYMIAEGYSPTTIVGNPTTPSDPNDPAYSNPLGRTIYGDRLPDYQVSWYNELTIMKNLTFNFLLHTAQGHENINLSALLWDDGGTTPGWSDPVDGVNASNFGTERLLQWAVEGNTGVYIQDASYVKLREIGLYYTFPKDVITRAFGGNVSNLKLGMSGNNVALWSDYGSYDPEVSNFGIQAITSAIEVTPYPSSRRIMFHLAVDF
jgi:TonB-linked SusC/RagA family outer membrane protein